MNLNLAEKKHRVAPVMTSIVGWGLGRSPASNARRAGASRGFQQKIPAAAKERVKRQALAGRGGSSWRTRTPSGAGTAWRRYFVNKGLCRSWGGVGGGDGNRPS
jgi:hypothetical protein